jgi:hypothetical protein
MPRISAGGADGYGPAARLGMPDCGLATTVALFFVKNRYDGHGPFRGDSEAGTAPGFVGAARE